VRGCTLSSPPGHEQEGVWPPWGLAGNVLLREGGWCLAGNLRRELEEEDAAEKGTPPQRRERRLQRAAQALAAARMPTVRQLRVRARPRHVCV